MNTNFSELYDYDDADRLIDIRRGILNGGRTAMTAFTSLTDVAQMEAWQLDKVGNWDDYDRTVDVTTNGFDRDHNVANEITSSGFAFDANGNMTGDNSGNTFEYDVENRLSRVKQDTTVIATYYYDALGRRVRKTIENSESDNATLIYIHNPDWQLLEVRDDTEGGDPAIQRFIHASGNQSMTASAYIDDHVAYDRWNGESWDRNYYFIDKQFNTVALFGDGITERVITDPYGRARTYDSSWANGADRSRIDNPFMHQGLYFDLEAGGVGYQNRFRQYAAAIGRFLQRDPANYANGASLFEYAISNPATFTDATGLDVWIETANPIEPMGHHSICVGDPNGRYIAYSFGATGVWDYLSKADNGEVYRDTKPGGQIIQYRKTTPKEDNQLLRMLESWVGDRAGYGFIFGWTCRGWCAAQWETAESYGVPAPPPVRPPDWTPEITYTKRQLICCATTSTTTSTQVTAAQGCSSTTTTTGATATAVSACVVATADHGGGSDGADDGAGSGGNEESEGSDNGVGVEDTNGQNAAGGG